MKAPTQHVCLSGFMGTGKSTVGRLLANRTGVGFVDLDARIEALAGRSVAEVFERSGEGAFRDLERKALDEALAASEPAVIALGGGTLMPRESRRLALARARVVTLTATAETSIQRLGASRGPGAASERPLLTGWSRPRDRAVELLESRSSAYAEAHATISTDARSAEEVADLVVAAWGERSLLVPLGRRSYSVRFARDLGAALSRELTRLAPTSWFLVTDENVGERWLPSLREELGRDGAPGAVFQMKPGETHKTLSTAEIVASQLLEAGADRGSVLVALGGGVVSDLTGFVAATFLRGIRWLAAPTTTLAMVDASVGGKTGVDLAAAKNALGAFHQPSGVLNRIAHVGTESDRAYRSGLAEAIKAGAIGDPVLLDELATHRDAAIARDAGVVEQCVRRALQVKIDIVADDEHESDRRALLNFGHTFGHAIEAAGGFARWTHGEAVALGMAAACELGLREAITDEATAQRLLAALQSVGLDTEWRVAASEIADYLRFDKKRRGQSVQVVLLRTLGDAVRRDMPLGALQDLAQTS